MRRLLALTVCSLVLGVGGSAFAATGTSAMTPKDDGHCRIVDMSETRAAAERDLMKRPGETLLEKVRARCRYSCTCYWAARKRVPCKRTIFMDCRGRLCSPCLARAKAQARTKCKRIRKGAIRRCTCPFKRMRLKR